MPLFFRVPFIHLLFGEHVMALWGLFIKFTLLHQDLVFRAFSETKESPESMSEKAYIPPTQREDVLELTVKSVS